MSFLQDIFDISIPGQRIAQARTLRSERQAAEDERQRQAEAFKAIQSGDVLGAAAQDPSLASDFQSVQINQQSLDSGQLQRQQQAGATASRAARVLTQRLGDPVAAFDAVVQRAGGLFGSPEELENARALVAENGAAAFDMFEQAFSEPRRTGTPSKPITVIDQETGEEVLATQDPTTGQLTRVEGFGPATQTSGGLEGLKAENIRSQISARETQTQARLAKEKRESEKEGAKRQSKADFALSSNLQALQAVDKALAFFGTDEDGDGIISDEERANNALRSDSEEGLGRIIGAARRRIASGVPGTDITLLRQQIEPLKGIVGLDRLVDLKSSGATLGQVSNFELQALQSTLGNLEQVDDPEQLFRDLQFIRSALSKINENLAADGFAPVGEGEDRATESGDVISFDEFMGGT